MSSAAYTILATSSRPQSPISPAQASMLDQQIDLVEILRSGEDSRLRRYRPERNDTPTSPAVVLFCGADQEAELDWDEHRPWVVEILPETEPPPARKRQKRSNGCGARIHARAMADRRWRGLVEGISMDVVRLEDEYFTPDMKRELLLGKERCGCCRSGVGCAICGNPLGALFAPCSRHSSTSTTTNFSSSHYTFLRAAVSPPLPLPTRRVSIPADDVLAGRGERESLQRRIRDREEHQQLRALRAAQASQGRPPRLGDTPDDRLESLIATTARRDRERERRMQRDMATFRLTEAAGTENRAAFEAWADATLQRATATAASDSPLVVDLSALVDLRASVDASPPEPATAPPSRELSEEERRRDWQRGVVSRAFGREWPTMSPMAEGTGSAPEPLGTIEDLRRVVQNATAAAAPRTPQATTDDLQREERRALEGSTAVPQPRTQRAALLDLTRETVTRTIERRTAVPEPLPQLLTVEGRTPVPERRSLVEVLRSHSNQTQNRHQIMEEEEKEEETTIRPRIFFER